jgi:hypothetical protein
VAVVDAPVQLGSSDSMLAVQRRQRMTAVYITPRWVKQRLGPQMSAQPESALSLMVYKPVFVQILNVLLIT